MAFWGISITYGGSITHRSENPPRRFRITQATLVERSDVYIISYMSYVECKIGDKAPIYICSLNKGSIPLEVEFEESEDITFRVRGPRGVHLSGYYISQITKAKTHLCKLKAAEDARSDDNALRLFKCMGTCTSRVVVPLENENVASIKHFEDDTGSNLEGLQQQFNIVEKACESQKDAVVQDTEISEPPAMIEFENEEVAGPKCHGGHGEGITSNMEGSQQQFNIVEKACEIQKDAVIQDTEISEPPALIEFENEEVASLKCRGEGITSNIEGSQQEFSIVGHIGYVQKDEALKQDKISEPLVLQSDKVACINNLEKGIDSNMEGSQQHNNFERTSDFHKVTDEFWNDDGTSIRHLERDVYSDIQATISLENDKVVNIKHLVEDGAGDTEVSLQQLDIVERTHDIQKDETIVQDAENLKLPVIVEFENEKVATIMHLEENIADELRNEEGVCINYLEDIVSDSEGSPQEFVIVERPCDVQKDVQDGNIGKLVGEFLNKDDIEAFPSANPESDSCDEEAGISERISDPRQKNLEGLAKLKNDEVVCVNQLEEDIASDIESSKQQFIIVKRTCDVQNHEVAKDDGILGNLGEELFNKDEFAVLPNANLERDKAELINGKADISPTMTIEQCQAVSISSTVTVIKASSYERERKEKSRKQRKSRIVGLISNENQDQVRGNNGGTCSNDYARQFDGDLVIMEKRNVDASVSMCNDKINDTSVPYTELEVGNRQLEKKKRKRKHQKVKRVEEDYKIRHVDERLVLEGKSAGEVGASMTHDKIHDVSVPHSGMDGGNMQKPEKKKRKRKHQDMKNVEDDCRARHVGDDLALEEKGEVEVGVLDDNIHHVSVPSTELDVGNMQKPEKKRKRKHQDVKSLEDNCKTRHVDDLLHKETTEVEVDVSMIGEKLNHTFVPSAGLDVGDMQITEKKKSKKKHQDVKSTGDNTRIRRVDGDLILKDKGNVEAIVINDISVPLVKSEVGNIQKLEKKKKRSAQQDVNNAEDDCRNSREVVESSVLEKKGKIKKGKSKIRRKLEDHNGVASYSNVLDAPTTIVSESKSEHKKEKDSDSDVVHKEKIQLNKRMIAEVTVNMTSDKLNDTSVSSTNLEVGNVQKLKKKKKKREHKDLKNIEDDCRNREEISQEQNVVAGKMHGKSSEGQTNSRPIVLALYNSQTRIHKK
ncbi:uncharacterized protein LOC110606127 isoform X3 [Manihot esculenta]|uniref:uncharacterized protein LOC110606127 isoform X3 n=1 Tax=Manihot esculenta TaxID=3983 RepID=UPI000B5D7487|nr:uncharacterized protein LOC110606127 isoform X3 [Manihot esculenta]